LKNQVEFLQQNSMKQVGCSLDVACSPKTWLPVFGITGRCWQFYKVRPNGRKLHYWVHALERGNGTLASPRCSPFGHCEVNNLLCHKLASWCTVPLQAQWNDTSDHGLTLWVYPLFLLENWLSWAFFHSDRKLTNINLSVKNDLKQ
jgi:hypothetical protein